jgi:hypothetical protein
MLRKLVPDKRSGLSGISPRRTSFYICKKGLKQTSLRMERLELYSMKKIDTFK